MSFDWKERILFDILNLIKEKGENMNAMYNVSYGLYIVTSKTDKINGCVANTLVQHTTTPNQVTITLNKANHTTAMIRETKKFNVSMLDTSTKFDIIKRFGFSSGKDTNKFDGFNDFKLADNGIPYITLGTNAYITCEVSAEIDMGTHIMFIATVVSEEVLSNNASLTYAEYHKNVKPKTEAKKGVWVCKICGYIHEGDELPEDFICPICKHGAVDFEYRA